MQGILFKKNIKSTSPLFLADLLEWRLVRVAATGIRSLAFRFTGSIDQIAIAGATPGLLLSFAVRGNVGLAMAFDWEPPGGVGQFQNAYDVGHWKSQESDQRGA
jgi:hypothetical protein